MAKLEPRRTTSSGHAGSLTGQSADHFGCDAMNFHALGTATLARSDSNSGPRHFQTRRQKNAQRFIRTVIQRGRGEPDFQSLVVFPDNLVPARSRLYADKKSDGSVFLSNAHGRLGLLSLSEQRSSHAHLGCPFFDGDLEIV